MAAATPLPIVPVFFLPLPLLLPSSSLQVPLSLSRAFSLHPFKSRFIPFPFGLILGHFCNFSFPLLRLALSCLGNSAATRMYDNLNATGYLKAEFSDSALLTRRLRLRLAAGAEPVTVLGSADSAGLGLSFMFLQLGNHYNNEGMQLG